MIGSVQAVQGSENGATLAENVQYGKVILGIVKCFDYVCIEKSTI